MSESEEKSLKMQNECVQNESMSVPYMQKNERMCRECDSPEKYGEKHLFNIFGQLSPLDYSLSLQLSHFFCM